MDANQEFYIEIYKNVVSKKSYQFKYAELEDNKISKTIGKGVRVFKDNKVGCAYGVGDVSDDYLIEKAKENLKYSEDKAYTPDMKNIKTKFENQKQDIGKDEIDQITKILKENSNEKISFPRGGISKINIETEIYNNLGVNLKESKTYYSFSSIAMCNDNGQSETGIDYAVKYHLDEINFEDIVKKSVEEAKLMIGAKSIGKEVPIVLPTEIAIDFLGIIKSSFSAMNVLKGKSMFRKELDETFNTKLVIIDNGIMKDGLGTTSFDDEGVPRQKTVLLENGKIKKLLHNTYTANEMDEKNTGNANRLGLSNVGVGETNFYIENGQQDFSEIFKIAKEVLVVKEAMGLHTANSITGEFSLGVSGYYLKNEEKTPVRGITIAGNLKNILNDVIFIGNDLKFYGNYGSPTLMIDKIKISS